MQGVDRERRRPAKRSYDTKAGCPHDRSHNSYAGHGHFAIALDGVEIQHCEVPTGVLRCKRIGCVTAVLHWSNC